MEKQTRYPLGTQSFEIIRKCGYLYVDKTMFIKPLLNHSRYVFLGRPRRFGKSLFMSMLEAYFSGRRELFEGLWIAKEETEWKKYPIIHLDLSNAASSSSITLDSKIFDMLQKIGASYGLEMEFKGDLDVVVSELIAGLHKKTGERVVLLVDEYDVALHELDENSQEYKEKKSTLRSMFQQFKASDRHVQFCFVTGVARFNQVSLFSGPNNITDISMDKRYASICGFTREELEANCREGILDFAKVEGISEEAMYQRLLEHYDGYRFTRQDVRVFNPLSIISALDDQEFRNYWVNTGITSLFINKLMNPDFRLPNLTEQYYDTDTLCSKFSSANPASVMFQTGYLTIDKCLEAGLYTLKVPNREVMDALTKELIPGYSGKQTNNLEPRLNELRLAMVKGDVEGMVEILRIIMSSVAYHLYPKGAEKPEEKENYYHTMTFLVFMMVSSYAQCEAPGSRGRSDMVAHTDRYVYVFEFKVDGTVEEAFKQMAEKGYSRRYSRTGKKVYEIAVVFSSTSHDIINWASRE